MKNLKKVLALALVFAMTLTLFAGAAFSDQESIGVDYQDDVNMLVELGVLKGYEDNSFRPENNVTRAEFAKMAYTLKYGSDDQGLLFSGSKSDFSDVEGVSSIAWAKGYINYCANQKIIAGVGNGKFNPNGNVTVAEAAKMLLVILGCDPQTEGLVGMNWQANTVAKAIDLGVFDGWSGDPTQPATRQLVAKLMRNTVFAPIYVYSPITGAGSQMQILEPNEENITLGQQTMGLHHETGIVVANEFNAISTDGDGAPFDVDDWEVGDGFTGTEINPTGKEQTRIMYEAIDDDGNSIWSSLVIPDQSLPDEMLGNLVDVYYTYEKESEKSKINVIGNVLVNSKTVVYEVNAADIDMMPNGESTKAGTMRPEIVFTTADGETITIAAPGGTERVNVKKNEYKGDAFINRNLFYSFNASPAGQLDAKASIVTSYDDVIANMGEQVPTTYRLVSIDGGANISYIFTNPNYTYGKISSYSESKGTIAGTKVLGNNNDLDDVVVYDGLKKGDNVIATVKDGKIVLEPTTVITGAVSSYSKNTVVINDETYVASQKFLDEELASDETTLADFYAKSGKGAIRGATYVTYGNLLLELDDEAEVAVDLGDYAVVLMSAFDDSTYEATVKLGLSDGTSATYTVSYYDNGTTAEYFVDDDSLAQEFANNMLLGNIVSYEVRDGKAEVTLEEAFSDNTAEIKNQGIVINGGNAVYANDSSLMFLLYNTSSTTRNVSFKTYKLGEMKDQPAKTINYRGSEEVGQPMSTKTGAVIKTNTSGDVLMAVMTLGTTTPSMLSDGEDVGYIVDSMLQYDASTRKNYLEVSLISMENKAIISGNWTDVVKSDYVGSAGTYQEGSAKFAVGSIAHYTHDGSNFSALDVVKGYGDIAHQDKNFTTVDAVEKVGFFKVTIADATKTRLTVYPYGAEAPLVGDEIDDSAKETLFIDDDEIDVVAIMDDEPIGEEIEEVSKYDVVEADDYNAIVELDQAGKVIKIFSLHGLIG